MMDQACPDTFYDLQNYLESLFPLTNWCYLQYAGVLSLINFTFMFVWYVPV
jgi:hypothetical protein